MGLIKAALGAAGGVLADQWKEYFYCDALPENVLAVKASKRTSKRSSNTKGNENIISDGSIIAVADGQCMAIVEQGKVVDICAEPGEYTYDCNSAPSLFSGSLSSSIKAVFKEIGKQFTFGGQPANDQRVYYFNTKELVGNKYGTASPVPFRIVDTNIGLNLDSAIKCFGEYSIRITNPILFYTNVCGNVEGEYTRDRLESQMKTELLTALQPALAKISAMNIRYSDVPAHTRELANALNDELSAEWRDRRGIEIVAFGISSMTLSEEDQKMIKDLQRAAALRDPSLGGGFLVGSQGDAMKEAAKNPGGAAVGFMNMNMAQNAGGMNAGQLYQMGAQQQQQQQAAGGGFCPSCGKPVPAGSAFCPSCGKPLAAPGTWTCPKCGKVNDGAFCPGCGTAKP
ncbi:MAG: SPFH domain-containing protein [Ruminococcaceae bacterium]|jgi:membrane protease subunit (stomatin/prohibitin family)|nr:SPFH domain-containing protein [Oscillospiraceae bacterium]